MISLGWEQIPRNIYPRLSYFLCSFLKFERGGDTSGEYTRSQYLFLPPSPHSSFFPTPPPSFSVGRESLCQQTYGSSPIHYVAPQIKIMVLVVRPTLVEFNKGHYVSYISLIVLLFSAIHIACSKHCTLMCMMATPFSVLLLIRSCFPFQMFFFFFVCCIVTILKTLINSLWSKKKNKS